MATYAVIENGVVTNMILWDGVSQFAPPTGAILKELPANSAVTTGWTWDGLDFVGPNVTTPNLTAEQQLALTVATAIRNGLTINSTSTPAINATYPITAASQADISSITNYVVVNGDFPGGASMYPWEDINGAFHIFPSVDLFKAWATAIADYVAQLKLYQAGAPGVGLPSPTVTIV